MSKKDRIKNDRRNKNEVKFHDNLAKSKSSKSIMRRALNIANGGHYKRFCKWDMFN